MIALVPVRSGRVPRGAETAVAAATGRVLAVGDGVATALGALRCEVREAFACEAPGAGPAAIAQGLAGFLGAFGCVVLPGSPDGRDLLGRLAVVLGRRAIAWCERLDDRTATYSRLEGRQSVTVALDEPVVVTVVPRAAPGGAGCTGAPTPVALAGCAARDAAIESVTEVAAESLELREASRIVAGGLGLKDAAGFAALSRVAAALGASLGATRPVADRGLVGHDRQIGTTGAAVTPSLYVAVGISGAVQHTAALGDPDHVVAVNTDPGCPMMAMADLAVVSDGPQTVRAMAALLGAL